MAKESSRWIEGDKPDPDCAEEFKAFRYINPQSLAGEHQRKKVRCPKGHLYDEVNSQGARVCGECRRANARARYAAKAGAL